MGSVRIDPFFYSQPALGFVDELQQPVHKQKPLWFFDATPAAGEVDAQGAYLLNRFPDTEGLLETAVEDFQRFLHLYEIGGSRYPVILAKAETECFEAYRIQATESRCLIEANDTEGIRRALVYIEDEMSRREGPLLPCGTISRKPSVRTRITRGFFSPTNRPPKNVDELMDDVDYYPDEYLNRLAHDGTNGVWIYTHFQNLLPSEIFPEYGKDWEKRISKLRRVVAKCKRYGVKVYVFGVEPASLTPEMAEKHPDVIGHLTQNNRYTVCTHTPKGAAYCIEVTQKLLELVPDLGGIIDISDGERYTTCSSSERFGHCPRCSRFTRGQVLAHTVNLFQEGIRRSGTNAEFISWTYGHRYWEMKDIQDYVKAAPQDVFLMENLEDAGFTEQLGKTRQAVDYWLSYVGPSQMYEGAAQAALAHNKHMFAKMQVCCSHEIATVPYIPTPGILFDKYAAASEYGLDGVMQCWYFGNYPSIMSKAAGELSFMEKFPDKQQFLEHLAGIYCGSHAKAMVQAWQCFEEGYKNYPINIMFSYYGPMHDGVVWDLALQPRNTSLPRTWMLLDPPDGDRIGECLQSGHTLEEAIILSERMRDNWQQGLALLPIHTPQEQRSIAQALGLLMDSSYNILLFYHLRTQLLKGTDDSLDLLQKMEDLVDAEIQNSEKMILLCEADARLGYHSEAEGYKFFPEKLQDRIRKLRSLKKSEFSTARENVRRGNAAITWSADEGDAVYRMQNSSLQDISEDASFRAYYDAQWLYIELHGKPDTAYVLYFEFAPMWPAPGIYIQNGRLELATPALSHQSIFGDRIQQELDKYRLTKIDTDNYLLTVSREKTGWTENSPFRAHIRADGVSWVKDDAPVHTLGKLDASPLEYGWLMPDFEQLQ